MVQDLVSINLVDGEIFFRQNQWLLARNEKPTFVWNQGLTVWKESISRGKSATVLTVNCIRAEWGRKSRQINLLSVPRWSKKKVRIFPTTGSSVSNTDPLQVIPHIFDYMLICHESEREAANCPAVQITFHYKLQMYLQNNWWDSEEFAWRCELDTIVHLFPVCEQTSFALVWCLKGSALHCV